MISNEILFLLLNAKIAFFSDIILNLLSTKNIKFLERFKMYDKLKTLRPYFKNKSMFVAAFYALLTVIIIVGITPVFATFLHARNTPFPYGYTCLCSGFAFAVFVVACLASVWFFFAASFLSDFGG